MNRFEETRADIVLKAFLEGLEPEKKRALVNLLPQQKQKSLEALPPSQAILQIGAIQPEDLFNRVHWSWFLPTLKSYTQIEQKLFLSSLNSYAVKNLARALTLSLNGRELTEAAKRYLKKLLLDSLLGPKNEILPTQCLPDSPLNQLLALNKKQLTHLIDNLSIFDLAKEIKQIVETKTLKKIYSLLSEEEKKLLKKATNQKDPMPQTKLGLERWDGSEETLRMQLHRRGLARFGAGLSGNHPDLIWYICHGLDIGRGTALYKACAKNPIKGVSNVIQKQIEECL